MKISLTASLASAIGAGQRDLVSIVGAGGKSSLMYGLARELASTGYKVLATTTTKIFYPSAEQADCVVIEKQCPSTIDVIKDGLVSSGVMVFGSGRLGEKIIGLSPSFADSLYACLDGWHMIVESDGARGKSFKIPQRHEPPLAQSTSIYAIVFGVDSLAKPLDSGYVFKPEFVAERLGVDIDAELDIDLVVRSLRVDGGYLWKIPPKARVCVVLNKVETSKVGHSENESPLLLAHKLKTDRDIERVVLGSLGKTSDRLFMVVR